MGDPHEVIHTELSEQFELEDELGHGGMGTVFLARDRKHDRRVAIKVIHPELVSGVAAKRFEREIRITAQLQHTHIVPLLDSGTAGGLAYYIMPYIEGESLRERLGMCGKLPVEEAVGIARDVAGALDYAHRLGVVHRDIKPENILICNDQAIVADFGIARAIAESDETVLTTVSSVVGTLFYISPEQLRESHSVDARADIYSLGCVLYEMLTGRPPFFGASTETIIRQHMSEPPEPLPSSVPVALRQAVMLAMNKEPAGRHPSAAAFASSLNAPVSELPSSSSSAVGYIRLLTVVVAVCTLLALLAVWWHC
jgi:serine/threonine-protein kinase